MTQATTTATASTWAIDENHSEIGFAVKHLMVATVKGVFRSFRGRVVLDETSLAASAVEAEIDTASIDTRQEQRDAHLRSADFFDAENYPVIRFRSTRIDRVGKAYQVTGELTIRGTTREVVLDVEETGRGGDPWGGERIGFTAHTKINREDFGLTWNQALETGGVLVSSEVRIAIDVQVVKQA